MAGSESVVSVDACMDQLYTLLATWAAGGPARHFGAQFQVEGRRVAVTAAVWRDGGEKEVVRWRGEAASDLTFRCPDAVFDQVQAAIAEVG